MRATVCHVARALPGCTSHLIVCLFLCAKQRRVLHTHKRESEREREFSSTCGNVTGLNFLSVKLGHSQTREPYGSIIYGY